MHLPSRFFVHFFAVAARLQRESTHTFFRFSVILSSDTLLKNFLWQYVDYTVIKQLFDETEYDMKNYADLGRLLSAGWGG